jgi:hypothetical protein
MRNTVLTLIIGGMLMSGFAVQAETPYRVSRYAVMEPVATAEQAQVSLRSRDAKQDIRVDSFALDHRQPGCAPAVPVTSPTPGPR